MDGNWDACAQWVYAWLERTFYTVQKVKGGVHFHQHVLQSDDMAGEVRSGLLSSRHRLEPKKAVESSSRVEELPHGHIEWVKARNVSYRTC